MKKIIFILSVCASSAFAATPSFGPGGQWTSGTFASATMSGTISGNFTRSGTTTDGTLLAPTLTGTTSAATLIISGSVAANGNTTLGDASGDTLTINAGTVTAPNQTAASASSVMTRSLVNDEPFFNLGQIFRYPAVTYGNSGTSSFGALDSGLVSKASAGTGLSGYGRVTFGARLTTGSESGQGIAFSRQIGVSARVIVTLEAGTVGSAARLVVGGNSVIPSTSNNDALSAVGFGVELSYIAAASRVQWRPFAHNGTTYVSGTYQNLTDTSLTAIPLSISVISSGAGSVTAYVAENGSRTLSSQTISGGPTTNGTAANSYLDLVAINSSGTVPTQNPRISLVDHIIMIK